MWVFGTIILLLLGAAVITALGRTPRVVSGLLPWDIPDQAGAHVGNVSTYGGFSLAAATFIAGLEVARTSPAFATVFGMMLVSFLVLLIAGWITGSAHDVPKSDGPSAQSLAFVLGNASGNLGISITWLALAPLVELVGLPALADVFIWTSLFMMLGGGAWVAFVAYRLTDARATACLSMPVLGLLLTGIYRLLADRLWPALWPASDAALRFAFVALALTGLMFALHLVLLVTHGNAAVQQRLQRDSRQIALINSMAYVVVGDLIWFALAAP